MPTSFAKRLASFTSWPHVHPNASTVAHAGFHQEFDPAFPEPDLVACSLCGLDPYGWNKDNEPGDPYTFHATRSPDCSFVRTTQQKKKLRNKKTRQQYKRRTLNAENIAEKATTSTVNTSLSSTTPHQAVKQFNRETASSSSNSNKIHGCNSFRLRFLAKSYHYTELVSPPGYMEYAKEMEATGQG